MTGLHARVPDTRPAPACRAWLLLGLLACGLPAQEGPFEDPRLMPITVQEPPGFAAHLARAIELAAQGRPEGAAGVLEDLARREIQGLVGSGKGLYLPAHEAIEETLAALDPAARRAWNLLAGTEADRLLRLCLAGRDETGLSRVARRYPGTEARDQALLTLADLALERGQPEAALLHLSRLERSLSSVEPARILGRMLLARAALRDWIAVRRTLERLDRLGLGLTVAGRTLAPGELAGFPAWAEPAHEPHPSLPGLEEPAARLWLLAVERPAPGSSRDSRTTSIRVFGSGMKLLPALQGPLAELDSLGPVLALDGERILVRHLPGLELLESATGRLLGRLGSSPGAAPERDPRLLLPSAPGSGLAERSLCTADGLVVLLTGIRNNRTSRPSARAQEEPPFLAGLGAWDSAREEWLWTLRFDSLPEPLDRATPHSGPALCGGVAAVLLASEGVFTVAGFCPREGRLRWTRALHGGGTTFQRPPVPPLLAKGEMLFAASGAGAVAALSGRTGDLLWLHAYPRVQPGREAPDLLSPRANHWGTHSVPPRGFELSPLVLRGETLVFAPPDGDYLVGLHAASGRLLWLSSRFDPAEGEREGPVVSVLVGADQERVYLAGRRLIAVEIATGRRLWQTPLLGLNGRGVVTGSGILIPTARGVLLVEQSPPFRQRLLDLPGLPAGPLALAVQGPFLIAAGLDRVGLWVAPGPWACSSEGLERALRLARCGRLEPALAALPASSESEPLRAAWSVDLARQVQAAGRIDETQAVLDRAVRETRSPRARLRLHEELFLLLDRSGRTEEARAAFQSFLRAALEADPERGS